MMLEVQVCKVSFTFKGYFCLGANNAKVVCRVERLLELAGDMCRHDGCCAK